MSIYSELGVKTYINALDTVSVYGGSRMPGAVFDAMEDASRNFVQIKELQQKACSDIARLTRNEAAYITSGASAALLLCAAVCMAGADEQKQKQLPDTRGMKNQVIVLSGQKNSFTHAVKAAGGTLVYVDAGKGDPAALAGSITLDTAAIFFFDLQSAYESSLSFEDTVRVAQEAGIPLIVDAAAQLPPVENLWRFTKGGADGVCFSGGKGLLGPQSGGLILGKQWLIDAVSMIGPPIHGIARSSKVGREEIVGVYAALCEYLRPGAVEAKVAIIEARGGYIRTALEASGLFRCERLYPGPTGQSYAYVYAEPIHGADPQALVEGLRQGEPGVLVGRRGEKGLMINPLLLRDEEVDVVIRRVLEEAEKLA